MAAKAFNGWVESDVAIEIIGKMIAEETGQLYALLADFRKKGYSMGSAFVQNDGVYQQHRARISQYQQEIQAIYDGHNTEEVLKRVECVYAPHLLEQNHPLVTR